MASAQAPRASDKARGYYGPAASPGPDNAIWLEPGVTGREVRATRARSYSYAPAPTVQQMRPAAPPAQAAAGTGSGAADPSGTDGLGHAAAVFVPTGAGVSQLGDGSRAQHRSGESRCGRQGSRRILILAVF